MAGSRKTFMQTMKAVRLYGPKDWRFEDVPVPEVTPDSVLIRVRAAGICATDVELWNGTMFYLSSGMTKYPFTPGHEWSGEVVTVGRNVTEFSKGDHVVGECSIGCRRCSHCRKGQYHLCANRKETGILNQDGAFAEYVSFPRFFLHQCNGLPFADAAFIEPTGVALNVVKKTRVSPKDFVVIMGEGPIGLFAVQVAKAYGARKVILAGVRNERLAAGKDVGADVVVNVESENLVQRVREATDSHMADVVIEAAGKAEVWAAIVPILAPAARVGITGLFAGARCAVDFDPLVVNEISMFGCLGGPNMWGEAISLHERKLVRSDRLITHRLPLADFGRGIEISCGCIDGAIKVLLEP